MLADIAESLSKVTDIAKPIVETGCNLINKLLGKPLEVAGDLAADQIYGWQWRNRIRIAEKAQRLLEESKVAARVLPRGFLLPLLEAAGNCEEDSLQDLWARLLANATADDGAQLSIHIETLRRLSPGDAAIFSRMAGHPRIHTRSVSFSAALRDHERSQALGRLEALGLVKAMPPEMQAIALRGTTLGHRMTLPATINNSRSVYVVTSYGRQFFAAVTERPSPVNDACAKTRKP